MGSTEQEKAEAMKRYIREVFIPEYAKNFNKELSASDIKFYGKIHFDRSRSDNELNMHCHLIVSRKDQANKKKLSPLTNHKNTKNGAITGGFDRVSLFQQAERGFDKLFRYNRQQSESFDYHNTMKNNSISEQLKQQEANIQSCERKMEVNENSNQENMLSNNSENKKENSKAFNTDENIVTKQECETSVNQNNNQTSDVVISLTTSRIDLTFNNEDQTPKSKKKKKKGRRL